jgi:hypothetical protein
MFKAIAQLAGRPERPRQDESGNRYVIEASLDFNVKTSGQVWPSR